MNKFINILIALLIPLLSACTGSILPPAHTVPVAQGNVLTTEQVDTLKLGMTKTQVEFVIGSPAIQDDFSPNTWIYLFRVTNANANTKVSQVDDLTLTFEQDKLVNITKSRPDSESTTSDIK